MKTVVLVAILSTQQASAYQYYTFSYKTSNELKVSIRAENKQEAFVKASKECYNILTKGVYPGEEAGLNIIDICANPK